MQGGKIKKVRLETRALELHTHTHTHTHTGTESPAFVTVDSSSLSSKQTAFLNSPISNLMQEEVTEPAPVRIYAPALI